MSKYGFTAPDWQWLRDHLIALLACPHFPSTSTSSGDPPLVDPFTIRYNEIFTHDVEGVMASKHVKREGLKEALLTVQKGWDPDSVVFEAEYAPQPRQVRLCTSAICSSIIIL